MTWEIVQILLDQWQSEDVPGDALADACIEMGMDLTKKMENNPSPGYSFTLRSHLVGPWACTPSKDPCSVCLYIEKAIEEENPNPVWPPRKKPWKKVRKYLQNGKSNKRPFIMVDAPSAAE